MIKYLNAHKLQLFSGQQVHYMGRVYWANMTTGEIYTQTEDAAAAGSVNGWKVATIDSNWNISPI